MNHILIIDDEEKLRSLLARILALEGFSILQADNCQSGLKALEQNDVSVVLCDVKLPDGNGVELVKKIRQISSVPEVVLLTAYGNIPDGVEAIKNGAFDYITKGDDNNRIIPLVYKALEKVALNRRVVNLEAQLEQKVSFSSIIGESVQIRQAIALAEKVAPMETTVLLTGETGTGKEVFAQAIHQSSNRRKGNFVAINCSAFTRDLLESEMFGYKAGAFTGASKDQKGLFEEANDGSIFLDELGEMSADLQAKLLRVLETGEYLRIGETKPRKTNARIIAATHRNLSKAVQEGMFRQDLYYRISVFQIPLPALRDRSSDIEILANHFLRIFAEKTNKHISGMSAEYLNALKRNDWIGNIRELKNVIERSVILANPPELAAADLPIDLTAGFQCPSDTFDLATAEKKHILKVLAHTNGNKTKTAELLQIALTTLYRKLSEYGIN